jgi:hypothetical protein
MNEGLLTTPFQSKWCSLFSESERSILTLGSKKIHPRSPGGLTPTRTGVAPS